MGFVSTYPTVSGKSNWYSCGHIPSLKLTASSPLKIGVFPLEVWRFRTWKPPFLEAILLVLGRVNYISNPSKIRRQLGASNNNWRKKMVTAPTKNGSLAGMTLRTTKLVKDSPPKTYFTSSDPHHDMSGGGCHGELEVLF